VALAILERSRLVKDWHIIWNFKLTSESNFTWPAHIRLMFTIEDASDIGHLHRQLESTKVVALVSFKEK
jgi:hypothetical protein